MKKTKIACVYHSIDIDGWMSAAIVNLAFNKVNAGFDSLEERKKMFNEEIMILCTGDPDAIGELNFIGYNYGQPVPDLSEYDEVIMCDISFPKEEMERLMLHENGMNRLTWIDHHISAIKSCEELTIKGLQDTKFAACELTWKYFFPKEEMPEIVRLLGRYDCFGHKGTEEEQKILEFQYGARERITDYKSAYDVLCITKDEKLYMGGQYFDNYINQIYDAGKAIYRYLCTDAKQSYKNGFSIELSKPIEKIGNVTHNEENKTSTQGVILDLKPYNFICINKERFNPINFGIDYHKEGYDGAMCFHIDNNKTVCISLYNDNGEVDCSVIAKSFGGGGHKGAAGCRMTLEQFSKLIS